MVGVTSWTSQRIRTMSTERTADVPLSLVVLAVVALPLAGCAPTPVQADPALEPNTVTVRPAQEVVASVAPSPNASDANGASANGLPAVSVLTALDIEDGAVVVLAGEDGTVVTQPKTPPDLGAYAAQHALEVVGTPYVWGGNAPGGFDCSGLVQYSYALAGLELPRVTIKQRTASRAIPRKQLRPGDLLFFHIDGKRYSHIGIYIGDGKFVHAPRTGKFVSTASLDNPYWKRNFGGARRPVSENRVVSDYRLSALDRVRTEY
jgi:murein DD-endopeptidase